MSKDVINFSVMVVTWGPDSGDAGSWEYRRAIFRNGTTSINPESQFARANFLIAGRTAELLELLSPHSLIARCQKIADKRHRIARSGERNHLTATSHARRQHSPTGRPPSQLRNGGEDQ